MSEHPLPVEVEKLFRGAVDKCRLTGFWSKLRDAARLSYSVTARSRGLGGWLQSSTGGNSSVGESRFGGIPDFPQALKWPDRGGKLLTFVAQIKLAEIPNAGVRLPERGMLYFFLGVDEPAWDIHHEILFWPGSTDELKATPPPSNADFLNVEMFSFDPAAVEFLATASLPSFTADRTMDERYDQLNTLRGFLDNPKNAREYSRLLGHPETMSGFQHARDAYFASQGHPELIHDSHRTLASVEQMINDCRADNDSRGSDHWSKIRDSLAWYHSDLDRHEAEMANWQLLLEVDSHSQCGMNWWDAGRLQFLIDFREVRSADFSKTYACITSH